MTVPQLRLAAEALLIVALLVGYNHFAARADAFDADRHRLLGQVTAEVAQSARWQAQARAWAALDSSATETAVRLRVGEGMAKHRADSLGRLLDAALATLPTITPAACTPYADALTLCRAHGVALQAALDTAGRVDSAERAAHAAAAQEADRWHLAFTGAAESRDSLLSLVRRAPGPCRIPLLRISCPVLGIGYGLGDDRQGHVFLGGMVPLWGPRS